MLRVCDQIMRFFPRPYTRLSLTVLLSQVAHDTALLFKVRFPEFNYKIYILILNNWSGFLMHLNEKQPVLDSFDDSLLTLLL